jgi:putative ABC transport system permease protein
MAWLKYLYARLRGLARSEAIHDEIDEEMRFHIDLTTEENVRRGMPADEARRDAERRFGDLTRLRERGYDVRGGRWLDAFWQDARFGARVLLKRPGFAIMAVVTLALGVGATTAIFSVVDSVLLRPLPYREPDRIVRVWEEVREGRLGETDENVAPGNFVDIRDQVGAFEQVALFGLGEANLSSGGAEPERLEVVQCSPDLVSLLGVAPLAGRPFLPDETGERGEPAVMLSEGLWKRRFGADPSVVGETVELDGKRHAVVGVLPASVKFPAPVDLWVASAVPSDMVSERAVHFLGVAARLAPDATLGQARAELDGLAARLERDYPQTNEGRRFGVATAHDFAVRDVRPALLLLLAAVGLVLLIACANVANLLLVRTSARQAEIALRSALGAGRWRLARQLLTESLLLALAGGALGVLLAFAGLEALVALGPAELESLGDAAIDTRVLAFTLAVTLATGLVFGLAPALGSLGADVGDALKDGAKGAVGDAGRRRARSVLVVAEVAVSLVLLVAAGLLARSFVGVMSVEPGFDARGVVTAKLELSRSRYEDNVRVAELYRQLCERVAALPGVRSAGTVNYLPLAGDGATSWLHVEGRPTPADQEPPEVGYRVAGDDYFEALSVPVARGRDFSREDVAEGAPVALVNEELAREFFDGDAVGRRIKLGPRPDEAPWTTVVGVVGSVRHYGLDARPRPEVYLPHAQDSWRHMAVVARTDGDTAALAGAIEEQVRALDPAEPVFAVRTMDEVIAASVAGRRFGMALLAAFAGLALVLAAVGLYSVVAYSAAQRTHEIGVRMALGARAVDVVAMVLRQGMALALAGVAAGLAAALAASRLLEGMVFGVSATDPTTFVAIAALLAAVALVASYVPARRAARVDPMTALRDE